MSQRKRKRIVMKISPRFRIAGSQCRIKKSRTRRILTLFCVGGLLVFVTAGMAQEPPAATNATVESQTPIDTQQPQATPPANEWDLRKTQFTGEELQVKFLWDSENNSLRY